MPRDAFLVSTSLMLEGLFFELVMNNSATLLSLAAINLGARKLEIGSARKRSVGVLDQMRTMKYSTNIARMEDKENIYCLKPGSLAHINYSSPSKDQRVSRLCDALVL